VPGVLVLIFWAAAVAVGLVVLGILGYGLVGHLGRLRRAVEQARAQLVPAVEALRPPSPPGRHRAD
jgi:hypothetical protein